MPAKSQAFVRMSIQRRGAGNPNWKGGKWSDYHQVKDYTKAWRKKNERHVRNREYKKRFGITIEQYEEMLLAQNGVCAICKKECRRGRLSVDHDHATGKVRGLLCRKCNVILGMVQDKMYLLLAAEAYLAR